MKAKVLDYTAVLKKEPEGGYTASVPLLPGCVTYGKNLEEAKEKVVEAIELYLESLKNHNEDIPNEKDVFYTHVHVTSTP